jgi:hypothetical protein
VRKLVAQAFLVMLLVTAVGNLAVAGEHSIANDGCSPYYECLV